MKTEYAYDPNFPYVVKGGFGYPYARFNQLEVAVQAAAELDTQVIDTTPKPKIPEDAEFILVNSEDSAADVYRKMPDQTEPRGYYWYRLIDMTSYADEEMPELIGDAEVTVLVPKETS